MIKSVYIHIPFCSNICSYCDFSKQFYNSSILNIYLKNLEKEILNIYKGEIIDTIYIGGGTPSCLSVDELKKLFKIIDVFKKSDNLEFTFECNPESMCERKIKLLKENGVNRVSIGVQSFDSRILNVLNRKHSKEDVIKIIDLLNEYGISNINIDMMFGVNEETDISIKNDLDILSILKINHVSYYSLILEPNTMLYINKYKEQDEDINADRYEYICKYLKKLGYTHYEISNFCKEGYESKHNLTYWNNSVYYGFGLGAHGYINNFRYENTRSISKYNKSEYLLNKNLLDIKTDMENEIILGFRKLRGINKKDFLRKFSKDIYSVFDINKYIIKGMLVDDGENIFINPKYIYVSNNILVGLLESSD